MFGGPGRVVRDFSRDERTIFSLKACAASNQPQPANEAQNPCHENDCAHLCFAVPKGGAGEMLVKKCACKWGFKLNAENNRTCIRDTSELIEPLCPRNTSTTQMFQCANGRCINAEFRCDGMFACVKDEAACNSLFFCISGENDCIDGSDEKDDKGLSCYKEVACPEVS